MNPFHPQDPVEPEYFYGRESIIERYKGNLRQDKPINMMLVGDWGIGKTSALNKLSSIEIANENIGHVSLSITNEEEGDFNQFAYSLLKKLREKFSGFSFDWEITDIQFKVVTISREEESEETKEQFIDKMTDIWKKASVDYDRIVLFLDDLGLMYPHQMMNIRNCFQELRERGCRYMLVGTCVTNIMEFSEVDEPFMRFFENHNLEVFTEKDSKGMINHILEKSRLDVDINDDVLERLHQETGGHPYHLTLFMHEIIRKKDRGVINLEDFEESEPEIIRGVRSHLSNKYKDLTSKDIETIKSAIKTGEKEFRPKHLNGIKNASDACRQLCEKEVFDRMGYGRYCFKQPMTRKYFVYEFNEKRS